jgi:solute carrier family 35 protein E1
MLACSFGLSFTAFGIVSALVSTITFVIQNIISKELFRDRKLDKLNMMLYSSSIAFILMTPIWYSIEGYYLTLPSTKDTLTKKEEDSQMMMLIFLFAMNGLSHFLQNVFAFSVLHLVSPVTYSIASLLKRIFVIVASIIWFKQAVTVTQGCGIVLTMFGLALYQRSRLFGGSEREFGGSKDRRYGYEKKLLYIL